MSCGKVTEGTLFVLDFVMHCFNMVIHSRSTLRFIGAFVAFEDLFWFWVWFWRLITVVTYALKRIILRPVGRSNFEYLLVNPVLPNVQDILVNRPLVLEQVDTIVVIYYYHCSSRKM